MNKKLQLVLVKFLIVGFVATPLSSFAGATVTHTDFSGPKFCDRQTDGSSVCSQQVKGLWMGTVTPAGNSNWTLKSINVWSFTDAYGNVQAVTAEDSQKFVVKNGETQVKRLFSQTQSTVNGVCTEYFVEYDFQYNGTPYLGNPSWTKSNC